MTEQAPDSLERSSANGVVYAANLLRFYSFDLGERTIDDLLNHWQESYPENWVRLALIEALYQGRYKAVSVEQILVFWQRRGQPLHRFNHDFERLICNKLPRDLAVSAGPSSEPVSASSERSRPQSTQPSNVVNFPTTVRRSEPASSIADPKPPLPKIPAAESLSRTRLREVLESDELAAAIQPPDPVSLSRTAAEPDDRRPAPPLRKPTPLSMPDFGLTPPHLSLKIRVQLAALYQPHWIAPAAPNPLRQKFVAAKALKSRSQPPPAPEASSPAVPTDPDRLELITDDWEDDLLQPDLW
jgi:hypothetical protein